MDMRKGGASRNNAVSHGVFASDVVSCEEADDFNQLHKSLKEELVPNGAAEEEAVRGIALLYWKKRCAIGFFQRASRRLTGTDEIQTLGKSGHDQVAHQDATGSTQPRLTMETLRAILQSHASALHRILQTVNKEIQSPSGPSNEADAGNGLKSDGRRAKPADTTRLEMLMNLAQALNSVGAGVISPMLKMIESNDFVEAVAELGFHPHLMERELHLLALVDKQIEKAMTHLIHLKEYKRVYRGPLLSPKNAG
jgi:hypothetical protein